MRGGREKDDKENGKVKHFHREAIGSWILS
ncbi:hypothetical protein OIU78_014330, partial [Salix suchowensis]